MCDQNNVMHYVFIHASLEGTRISDSFTKHLQLGTKNMKKLLRQERICYICWKVN